MSCSGISGCASYYYNTIVTTFRNSVRSSADESAAGCVGPLGAGTYYDASVADGDLDIDSDDDIVVSDGDADTDVDGDVDTDGDTDTDIDADGDADTDTDVDSDGDVDSDSDIDVDEDGETCLVGEEIRSYSGNEEEIGVGICQEGVLRCEDRGEGALFYETQPEVLPQEEVFGNGVDEDCSGYDDECADGDVRITYDGPEGTEGIGICQAQIENCVDSETGYVYEVIQGQVLPGLEIPRNGVDENCDGEDTFCILEDERRGYSGDPETRGIGPCQDRIETCEDRGEGAQYYETQPEVLPQAEVFGNGIDENCSGYDDECADGDERITYEGPEGTAGTGICQAQIENCVDSGTGYVYEVIQEQVLPATEILANGIDENCDGEDAIDPCSWEDGAYVAAFGDDVASEEVVIAGGNVWLRENDSPEVWTSRYDGDVDPALADPAWIHNPTGWGLREANPATGIFHSNTIGTNGMGRIEGDCGFNNDGWIVQSSFQILSAENDPDGGFAAAIFVGDTRRYVRVSFLPHSIQIFGGAAVPLASYDAAGTLDLTSGYNVVRIVGAGNNVYVYLNDFSVPVIDGESLMTATMPISLVYWNDCGFGNDSEINWDYLYCNNEGEALPYYASGTLVSEAIWPEGGEINFVGGALTWSAVEPSGTSVRLALRSAETCDEIEGAIWTSEFRRSPVIIPAEVAGNCLQYRATLTSPSPFEATPILSDIRLSYEAWVCVE